MANKKYFIVLDTETAGGLDFPMPYDVGFAVVDKRGNVYESYSFVVYEIYCKEKDTLKTAYYADKIPQYEKDIEAGMRKIASLWTIRKTLIDCMERYNTKTVFAYNMNFDKKALNNDIKHITNGRLKRFFPKETEFYCIWSLACNVLMTRKSFVHFAENNNFISPSNNLLTSAEVCYRYITDNTDFIESHTGLEDVMIEKDILAYCFRQKKKFDAKPNSNCWMKVKKFRNSLS